MVGREHQAGAVEPVWTLRGPLVGVTALVQRVLQRGDRVPVGPASLLRAGQVLGAEPAVRRVLGGLGSRDLGGVLLLEFL